MIRFGMPTLVELPTLEDNCALCRDLGLKFVEINMSFPQYQPETMQPERLNALRREYGIFFTVHIDEALDPCTFNKRAARAYVDTVLETARIAKEAGIPTLNMHLLRGIYVTLPEKRVFLYGENEREYLEGMCSFRDAFSAVADGKVKLCMENTDGFDLPFLVDAIDLVLQSPDTALTFDIGHDNAINHIDEPIIMARGDRLIHMHMHDGLGKRVHLALGDGDMDIPRFLEMAEEHDCRVVLETKTVAALRKSVAYLKAAGRF